MSVTTIGLDLAKSVFQVHGVDVGGHAVLRRQGFLAFFAELPPCLVGMESCSSAHHWARELVELGHDVRLIPPQYVKPFVRRNKTDAADAEAICEAVGRPSMRFVPIKSKESQGLLTLHRVRSLLVRQRTATVNAARGLLSEFGIVAAKGIRRVADLRRDMEGTNESVLPREARTALDTLFDHLDALTAKLGVVDQEILAWHKTSEASQRLATAPGVGPLTATALIAAVGDASQFTSARHFAAWLGLTRACRRAGIESISVGSAREGSLPAHAPDTWCASHGRHELPSRGPAAPVASGADRPAPGQRRRGGGRAQDGARALGNDPTGGGVSASTDVRSRRLTEIGAAQLAAPTCEGSKR